MRTIDKARHFALSLPEATEHDHHGFPSFRVAGKIFATVPDPEHLHVMVAEEHVEMAVGTSPRACEELRWGKRLSGVRVTVANIDWALLTALLTEAWRCRAPRRLSSVHSRAGSFGAGNGA